MYQERKLSLVNTNFEHVLTPFSKIFKDVAQSLCSSVVVVGDILQPFVRLTEWLGHQIKSFGINTQT
jgi:hypothetical protein